MARIATRRERVVLELEDNFTTGMARAAASASLLSKELNSLSGTSVRSRSIDAVSKDMDKAGKSANQAGPAIDRFSGRLGLLRDVALTIGPAFIPIGALAVPAVTGLAASMGAAAIAGGAMIAAFQGMGGALEAVNKAALEPTSDNLHAAAAAMQALSPQAQQLVEQLQDFRPALLELRNAAGAGLFPGVGEALADLELALPGVERLLFSVGGAAGKLAEEFGAGIAGPRGEEFISFLATEAPSALLDLGRTLGNLTAGLAELWMAFTPLNNDFSNWMLEASRSFDQWAQGLSQTQGFNDFIDYIRTAGPQVADAMGAIGNAVLQIVQAAAPLGGPTLAALEAVANVIAAIAGSAAGPALFALASGAVLVARAMQAIAAVKASSLFAGLASGADGATKSLSTMQRVAVGATAALAGLAVVDALQGGLEDYSIGVQTMTASILDMNEAMAAGLPSSMPANLDGLADSIDRLANPGTAEALQDTISSALGGIGNEEEYDRAIGQVESIEAALTNLVQTGRSAEAEQWLQGLNLSDADMADFLSLMPDYEDALAGVSNEGRAAAAAARGMADGFRQAESAAQTFSRAVAQLNRTLEGRASLRDYEAALDDFGKAVRKNGRTLDITTAKGRENQAALDAIASSALQVAEGMNRTNRIAFLRTARADMIDAAMKLGMTRAEARRLADQLGLLDNMNVNPQVQVDTARAEGNVRNLLSAMAQLRDRTVTVTTVFTESGRRFKDFDTGGYTGAGHRLEPRGIVHAGEVVIPQWLVKRDWNLLKQRYGHLPGFASGGLVSAGMQQRQAAPIVNVGPSSFSGSVAISDGDVQRIANAVRNGVSAGFAGQSQAADRNVRNMMRGGR